MTKLNIATFNVENLFNRYSFLDMPWDKKGYDPYVAPTGLVSLANRKGELVDYQTTTVQRNNTAQAILDIQPDILCVNEIENMYTLRNFNSEYLNNYFDRIISIDGNDARGIDVGFCVKAGVKVEITGFRTHIDEPELEKTIRRYPGTNGGFAVENALFSRDCLEVDVLVGNTTLTFLVNHLKSQDNTTESVKRRARQANRVAEFVTHAVKAGKRPIVIGDLNVDYTRTQDGSIDKLVNHTDLADPWRNENNFWTHFYAWENSVSRLDYILPFKGLTVTNKGVNRKGLTTTCTQYTDERYPTVGPAHTEASDHCPTWVQIDV